MIADRGGKLALTELGDKQVVQSGTEDTAAAQQPAVQAAIQSPRGRHRHRRQRPGCALCPALKQAQAAGTHVIAFDSDVSCRQLFINQADTETIGRSQVKLLGEADGLQGRVRDPVGCLHGDEPERLDQVHEARAEEACIQEHEAREDLLRQRQPGAVEAGDRRHAPGVPEPEGHRVPDDGRHLVGCAVPVDVEEYKNKIALTGLGLPSQMKKYVHDGTVKAFALWNPEDLGYLAGYAISAFAEGKIKGKVGETFKAGKLGTYKILLGPDKRAAGDPRAAVRVHDQERRQVQVLRPRGGAAVARRPPLTPDRDDSLPTPVLSLEHAQKSFGAVHALEDGDIELFGGEVHGLVGENGAGKSTLVKILAGVHRPDAGRLLLDGEEAIFDNAKQSQAAGIAIIFQEPTLFPDLTRRREHLRRRAAAQALPAHRRQADAPRGGRACSTSSASGSTPTGSRAGSRSPISSSSRSPRR